MVKVAMKLRTYKAALVVFLLFLLFADYVFGGFTAVPFGKINAYVDAAFNNQRLKLVGLPGPGTTESKRLLQDRYGVSLDQTAGCIYQPWLFKYAESYNSVSKSITRKKFGRDVFKECYKDGYRTFLTSHPPRNEEEKDWWDAQLKELESY